MVTANASVARLAISSFKSNEASIEARSADSTGLVVVRQGFEIPVAQAVTVHLRPGQQFLNCHCLE